MPRFTIDPDASQIWIEASSSLHPIHSHTGGLEGELTVGVGRDGRPEPGEPPAVVGRVSFPVDKLRSGNPLEDRELRRRIDAGRFPTIDGTLVALAAGGSAGSYRVDGDITFRGVTQRFSEPMQFTVVDPSTLELSGRATFDVRTFGLEPPRILMVRVHPEVTVRVEITARLQSAP